MYDIQNIQQKMTKISNIIYVHGDVFRSAVNWSFPLESSYIHVHKNNTGR